ncbi:MAG TPA: acyl-CoA thioesterase [Gammaproteobacteria bacterium]|nr:acyl-CoA thioesterase [Gammaproteobacteria bacterium]
MNLAQFTHITEEHVRWGDCDMLGHVNNTLFLRYIESARIAYIEEVMHSDLLPGAQVGWVIADLHCNFRGQLHYPAKLETGSRITRVGSSSATIEAAIFANGEPAPVFTSTAVIVWCDYQEGKSLRIPDRIREAIRGHEGDVEGL